MATVSSIEYDILHNKLGWSDEAIRSMGEALVDDIVADYAMDVMRYPLGRQGVQMAEPTEVAEAAFWEGVGTDIADISQMLRRGFQRIPGVAGAAASGAESLFKDLPFLLLAFGALGLFLWLGRK